MRLNKKLLGVAISAALFCGQATAKDDKHEQLEAKIANLETMLLELRQELDERKQHQPEQQQEQKQQAADSEHSYAFGGFVKTSASFSSYSDGDLPAASGARDFYVPGATPVGGEGEGVDFDFTAKESVVNFKSDHILSNGGKVGTFVEIGFFTGTSGNERVSNSYRPEIRHAFITYNNWMIGQNWSTFQDVGALTDAVDFLGASDGVVFIRQPQIRYTNGPWQIALENPESSITTYGGGGSFVSDDNSMPDFVLKYTLDADWGHVSLAGLARTLEYDTVEDEQSEFGFGVMLSGLVKLGARDDIRFNVATGSGMGRYAALNLSSGAVITDDGSLELIDSSFGTFAYRHFWNDRWRSNIILSGIDVDNNTDYTGFGVTKSTRSAQLNLMYSPAEMLTFGVGLVHGKREIESGTDGEMNRLVFTAQYVF